MKFDFLDNLTEQEIQELYDDVIELNKNNVAYWFVECLDGRANCVDMDFRISNCGYIRYDNCWRWYGKAESYACETPSNYSKTCYEI